MQTIDKIHAYVEFHQTKNHRRISRDHWRFYVRQTKSEQKSREADKRIIRDTLRERDDASSNAEALITIA